MWSSGAEGTETLGVAWSENVLLAPYKKCNSSLLYSYFGNISDDTHSGHGVDQGDTGPEARERWEESMMNLLAFNYQGESMGPIAMLIGARVGKGVMLRR
ncbi:hypothetical protein NHX12_008678 [Muraenolepis orangiensis]|uniref:Uncharacterized protein n=1 Tax=Muraenolepis orangiensis TaxID=630683 RepID=A0A9Q0DLR7_9TELE|nr:hypothetical protein NHX12_008678 [Muraenolepis orangiensis]